MPIIKSETWDGVTAPAIPSGWTVDSPLVTSTANTPSSAPNALAYPIASGGSFGLATWGTADGHSGNVQLSSTLRFVNSSGAGPQQLWLYARGSALATAANWGTASAYVLYVQRNGPPDVNLYQRVGGTNTLLASLGTGTLLADATNYRFYLLCYGSTIQVRAQRLSDGLWLNSSAAWVADSTNSTIALSVSNSAIAASSGYSGLGYYLPNTTGGDLWSDDFLLETSGPTFVASPSTLLASSGPQTVSLVGNLTAFSTSSSTQFTLSGGTGASLISQSASSTTAASLLLDPGIAAGTLTITDTSDGNITAHITVASTVFTPPNANEIATATTSGTTLYALIRNTALEVWNTQSAAFETYSSANYAHYALALSEQGASGFYAVSFPSAITTAGLYSIDVREQAGTSPATSDAAQGGGSLAWTGAAEVLLWTNPAGQVQQAMNQAVPASNAGQTVGDALNAARAQGFGKWVLSGTTLELYAADGSTIVRTFTLDSAVIPTTRS